MVDKVLNYLLQDTKSKRSEEETRKEPVVVSRGLPITKEEFNKRLKLKKFPTESLTADQMSAKLKERKIRRTRSAEFLAKNEDEIAIIQEDDSSDDEENKQIESTENAFTKFKNYIKEPENLKKLAGYAQTAIYLASTAYTIYGIFSNKGGSPPKGGRRNRRKNNNNLNSDLNNVTKKLESFLR